MSGDSDSAYWYTLARQYLVCARYQLACGRTNYFQYALAQAREARSRARAARRSG